MAAVHSRRHLLVIALILICGWGAAIPLYVHGAVDDPLPMELTEDTKLNDYRLERLAGKSGVYYHQLYDGLASLWHGANLGITVFVLTSLVALSYYLAVSRRR
ncbi:MAG TPA: hypothetical protein VGH20_13850 [Myxococcales bacterium]|jgi:hypothetical protein